MTSGLAVKVGRRRIDVSNPDKVLFPEDGITKAELVEYCRAIGDRILPHLAGRPLVLERHPDGIHDGFIQKEASDHFPDWVDTASMSKRDGQVNHVVCNDVATLVYLAGQAMVTPHVWTSRVDSPQHPDQMVFDLDPSDGLADVPRAAAVIREVLDEVGLVGFPKSSGSKGIHIHVPLDGAADFSVVRPFSRQLADVAAARHPEFLTTAQRKVDRGGRLFLDTNRNAYAQHAAAPFAVRARPGAPVAAPLDWDEATASSFDPRAVTIANVFRRLGQKDDPWKGWRRHTRSLEKPRARLDQLTDRR